METPNMCMRFVSTSVLFLAAAMSPVRADVVTLVPTKDNTLYEDPVGALSNGSGSHFFAGLNGAGQIRRGLLAFDIAASLPAGSTVTAASLTLRMSRTSAGAQSVRLFALQADWGEGSSAAPGQEGFGDSAATGDATWLHTSYASSFWATPGGDPVAASSATTSVSGIGNYTWASAQMAADVQGWLAAPGTAFGWIVIGSEPFEGSTTAKRFNSREHASASERPKLTITFTPPAAAGACCLPDGACLVLDAGECTVQGGTYQGDGTSCSPNTCPQPSGACCLPSGACVVLEAADCATQAGTWQGAGTTCAGTSCPLLLEPFVDPLPIPAVATPASGMPGGAAHYDIAMTQFQQQLHRDLPPTTVWGYGGTFPGPTIEAAAGETVTVSWINDLRDGMGQLRTDHILPVDLCPHGATNEPKTVVHLHGAHAEEQYDGYPEDTYLPGASDLYVYPNEQLPATLWYHDHALGITRLNVYMGLAGFYLIRDVFELGLDLPGGVHEIPLVVQDRSFEPDGSFAYPSAWQEHFFGDFILVNGKVWPYLDVARGKYRFRLLNGSNARTYTLALSDGATFFQIGSDGGLLEAPVPLTELTISPGERADVIIDFEGYAPGTEVVLANSAPVPFPNGAGGVIPDVMKFVVTAAAGDTDPVPATLRSLEVLQESDALEQRQFELRKTSDPCTGSVWLIDGLHWDHITERPILGSTEVWGFANRSGISHPMHMHLVMFQVLDRQPFTVVGGEIVPTGSPVPPPPNEVGWKDTVRVGPMEIARVIARFEDYKGRFPYHCHILEHEDHEMMRQFETVDFAPFCAGDGSAEVDCPCSNLGSPGRGCDNAQGSGGVQLQVAAFAPDGLGGGSITLQGSGFPSSTAPTVIGIRSAARAAPPVVFGDGLRCVGSPIVRFGAASASGGVSTHTVGHGAGVGIFHYQLWYRNQPGGFCTSDAFNLSNGMSVSWP